MHLYWLIVQSAHTILSVSKDFESIEANNYNGHLPLRWLRKPGHY